MKLEALTVLLVLAGVEIASAQTNQPEALFVGELRSLTLTPRDREAERQASETERQARRQRGEADEEVILVSNSCGRASATFLVLASTHTSLTGEIETHNDLGEWCDPPVSLTPDEWLIVVNPQTRELIQSYEVIVQNGAAYALFLDVEHHLASRAPQVRSLLSLAPLPEPIEYSTEGAVPSEALTRWVSARPALELRDGKVWIVRAIPLGTAFRTLALE
jgi:hypothetical protein